MWIQHHNGIFHSETGVDGWSQIETVDPSFGFAVAVHPERPGTAWFVPAIQDEYRYPNDGRSEERRAGNASVSTSSSRWAPYHSQTKPIKSYSDGTYK